MADFRDVAAAGAELAVTVGIVEAAIEGSDDLPDEVKENLVEKVDAVVEYLNQEVLEFQSFGEAYDSAD
jgi:hypothetical protein